MSVEFDTPANRIIEQLEPRNKFGIQLLPDIAFLRQLSIQGRMRYFQGSGDGTGGNDIIITPPIGETLFIAGGTWSAGGSSNISIRIRNDGNVRAQAFQLSSFPVSGNFNFGVDSLVGDSIKQYTVDASHVNTSVFNIWGWVENTARIRDVTT